MKKHIFIVLLLCCMFTAHPQQTYPLKETYDQILEPYYSSIDYNSTSIAWWWSWGAILESYLKMYETTHDKAYLNKFIKHPYGAIFKR